MKPGASQLTLEQFASIAAALEAGVPRDEELASRGLSNEAWESEQERWLSRLAAQAASGNVRSSVRYAELLRAQTEPAAKRAKHARIGLEGATPAVPVVRLTRVVDDTRSRLAPSALREPPAAVIAAPVPVPPRPVPTRKQTVVQMDAFDSVAAAAGPVLPFQPAAAARPAKPAESSVRQTRVFEAPPAVRPALPFAPTPSAPSPTGPITARTSGRAPGPVLPFLAAGGAAAKSSRSAESFTLAEYAKICATVRAFPDHVAGIRSHYGLDLEGWKAMHALWQARFDKDAALKARWQMLVERNLQTVAR